MRIEIEISDGDVVNQNEYADWYCSRAGWRRTGDAADGRCRVESADGRKDGTFDLVSLVVGWDDGTEDDAEVACATDYDWSDRCNDFDCLAMVWATDVTTGSPVNVLWGVA